MTTDDGTVSKGAVIGERRARHQQRRLEDGYGIVLSISLPRDELSVPLIRHLVRDALASIGVREGITNDIELALTEACTNVVDHAGPGDDYEVTVTIGSDRCDLRVIDIGHGFDHATVNGKEDAGDDLHLERGRGLGLMQALVDHLELVSEPEEGTLVRLGKALAFDEDSPARRLLLQEMQDTRTKA